MDARDAGIVKLGTPLRDAAVDPRPGDFLVPTNAGEADPHGPLVVAPGIHGAPPAPLVPGVVIDADDPEQRGQEKRETDAAQAALVENKPVHEVVQPDSPDRGPLGLSDPSSGRSAKQDDAAPDSTPAPVAEESKAPAKRAAKKTSARKRA